MSARNRSNTTSSNTERHQTQRVARSKGVLLFSAVAGILGITGVSFAYPPAMRVLTASESENSAPEMTEDSSEISDGSGPERSIINREEPKSAAAAPSLAPSAAASPTASTPSKPPAAPPTRARGRNSIPESGDSRIGAVINLVNKERQAAGCRPLAENTALNRAAQRHADDMFSRGYFSHVSLDGTQLMQRVQNAGFTGNMVAENIAKGQKSSQDVMHSWMNSPGHRANILNCSYTFIGIGIGGSAHPLIWVQNFGG